MKGTVDFYVDKLGFTCNAYRQDLGWTSLSIDDGGIMFAWPNEHTPFDRIGCTGSLYLNTDDVDAWWEKLKDKANICYPIENFEHGMREFAIFDNNG